MIYCKAYPGIDHVLFSQNSVDVFDLVWVANREKVFHREYHGL